tara:strand:- start:116 stop:331 length:216 start_codon:yes stop_codon:yes gene_type:complete
MKIDFNSLIGIKNHLESKMNFILFVSLSLLTSFSFGQYDFLLEDLNTTSPSFNQDVSPSGNVSIVYFGHYN